MKILDKYIIKKYMGTLAFMLVLLCIIIVVIDVQSKAPRIETNGYTVGYFLLHFYPYLMLYYLITFFSILVFISVIYFTSRIANNTEIVAYISSGASFHRFAKPYLIASLIIAFCILMVNHFILPWSNIKKNELEVYTMNTVNREKLTANAQISTQLNPNEYIFINSYSRQSNRGSGYLYQKFDKNKKLLHQINASEIYWDEKKKLFIISNYLEKTIGKNDTEILKNGDTKLQNFKHPPEELFPNELLGQNKTTPDLIRFIKRETEKGNSNINVYQNELHQRTAMPVSIIILTFLALSLSSQKKRGGLGMNLALGIALAFVFVFSFEILKVVAAENNSIPPLLAMWIPNIIFGSLAFYLYWKRANQ
ncbi:LptF/LptG family permease [Cloacibacterium sp.]|jgi:lipopolysaccharide export system permease protein|uniref:LptF/LptG family permease n=1 Tax=Cloacibacterium sp. TaxID=1913682 RepID=UPI0035B42110